jgi:hypothetical protein
VDQDREFQRKRREFQEDLNARKNEELQQVLERANRVVKQVAEAEKYDLILQEAVYINPKHDITDKVIKALNAAASNPMPHACEIRLALGCIVDRPLGGELDGDPGHRHPAPGAAGVAGPGDISFPVNPATSKQLAASRCGLRHCGARLREAALRARAPASWRTTLTCTLPASRSCGGACMVPPARPRASTPARWWTRPPPEVIPRPHRARCAWWSGGARIGAAPCSSRA